MEKKDKGKPKQENKPSIYSPAPKARKPSSIRLLGFLLSLAIAGAYVVGTSFYEGYMQGQGFSSVHFPIALDERYLMAYYAVVVFLFKTVEPLTNFWQSVIAIDWSNIAVLGRVGLVVHIIFRCWTHRARIDECLAKRRKRIEQENRSEKYRVLLTELFVNVGIVYSLMIVSLLPMALVIYISGVFFVPNAIGLTRGIELKSHFRENGCVFDEQTGMNECVDIISASGEVLITGKLIIQHNRTIGIIDSTSMSSIVYELKGDDKIERSARPVTTQPNEAIK